MKKLFAVLAAVAMLFLLFLLSDGGSRFGSPDMVRSEAVPTAPLDPADPSTWTLTGAPECATIMV